MIPYSTQIVSTVVQILYAIYQHTVGLYYYVHFSELPRRGLTPWGRCLICLGTRILVMAADGCDGQSCVSGRR